MIIYLVEKNPKEWKSKISEDLRHDIVNITGIFNQVYYGSAMNKKNGEITEEDKERVVNLVRALKASINNIYILNYYIEISQGYISVGTYENNLVNLFHPLKEGVNESCEVEIESKGDFPIISNFPFSYIYNLLNNMIKNAYKHGEAKKVKIIFHVSEKETKIEISDNGKGIDEKIVGDIFKKGFSGGGSTGLGLSSTREILDLIGGKVEVEANGGINGILPYIPEISKDILEIKSEKYKNLNGKILTKNNKEVNSLIIKSMVEKISCDQEYKNVIINFFNDILEIGTLNNVIFCLYSIILYMIEKNDRTENNEIIREIIEYILENRGKYNKIREKLYYIMQKLNIDTDFEQFYEGDYLYDLIINKLQKKYNINLPFSIQKITKIINQERKEKKCKGVKFTIFIPNKSIFH